MLFENWRKLFARRFGGLISLCCAFYFSSIFKRAIQCLWTFTHVFFRLEQLRLYASTETALGWSAPCGAANNSKSFEYVLGIRLQRIGLALTQGSFPLGAAKSRLKRDKDRCRFYIGGHWGHPYCGLLFSRSALHCGNPDTWNHLKLLVLSNIDNILSILNC